MGAAVTLDTSSLIAEAGIDDSPLAEQLNDDSGDESDTEESEPASKPEPEKKAKPVVDDEEPEKPQPKPKVSAEGTLEKPYTTKTLPSDQYVEIQVDGEKDVVSLSDLAGGYMREKAFYQRLNEIDLLRKKAVDLGKRATARENEIRGSLNELFSDPDQLFELMSDRFESSLEKLARKYATQHLEDKQTPGARERRQLERERAKWERERKSREESAEAEARSAREREEVEAAERNLKPGFIEGMKAAGFPKMTQELRETIHAVIEARRRLSDAPITAEDLKNAVVRAAKLVGEEAARKAEPEPVRRTRKPAKQQEKSYYTLSEKLRDDDFWLDGVE